MKLHYAVLLLLFVSPASSASVRLVSAPDSVQTGEPFDVIADITADSETLKIYSYVYLNGTCFSLGGWTANAQTRQFGDNETIRVTLQNVMKHDAPSGDYTLKVRAKGAEDYDALAEVRVEQKEPDLFREVESENPELNLLFPALILPLLALLAAKSLFSRRPSKIT
jgi:hypothetical protein